jgi:hypothetical protein
MTDLGIDRSKGNIVLGCGFGLTARFTGGYLITLTVAFLDVISSLLNGFS